jgi:hypothetical protein
MEAVEIKDLIYELLKRIVDDEISMRSICVEFDNDMNYILILLIHK